MMYDVAPGVKLKVLRLSSKWSYLLSHPDGSKDHHLVILQSVLFTQKHSNSDRIKVSTFIGNCRMILSLYKRIDT